jgi:hypothetical protein
MATGLSGDPVPPTIRSGAAKNRNSHPLLGAPRDEILDFPFCRLEVLAERVLARFQPGNVSQAGHVEQHPASDEPLPGNDP